MQYLIDDEFNRAGFWVASIKDYMNKSSFLISIGWEWMMELRTFRLKIVMGVLLLP